jgi:hypothetical protein
MLYHQLTTFLLAQVTNLGTGTIFLFLIAVYIFIHTLKQIADGLSFVCVKYFLLFLQLSSL